MAPPSVHYYSCQVKINWEILAGQDLGPPNCKTQDRERARNVLFLKYGLGESKYWFLSRRIFVSEWVHELSNLGGTITSL